MLFGKPVGQYSVGIADVEFDADPSASAAPFEVGHADGQGSPDPDKHVVARLFYPSTAPQPKKAEQLAYLPDRKYAEGLGRYASSSSAGKWWSGIARSVMTNLVYFSTAFERLPAAAAPPPATAAGPLPVLVFSHGVAGSRILYSRFLSSVASHGFLVVAVEHSDGLGSAARLAGDRGWLLYKGWGSGDFMDSCTRHRVAEMKTAMRVVHAIQADGAAAEHVTTRAFGKADGGGAALEALKGKIDTQAVALAGHSWGGATVAVAAPDIPEAKCVVLLDTWYPAIPKADRDALGGSSPVPLLALGSAAFHKTRTDNGGLVCDGFSPGLQAQTLAAFAAPDGRHASVLVVPTESPHTMVDDLGAVFKQQFAWLFKLMRAGKKSSAPEARPGENAGLDLADRCTESVVAFCCQHLPMHADLRQSLASLAGEQRSSNGIGNGAVADVPSSLAGVSRAVLPTVQSQLRLFGSGGVYNGHAAPGYSLLEVHSKGRDGNVVVHRESQTSGSEA